MSKRTAGILFCLMVFCAPNCGAQIIQSVAGGALPNDMPASSVSVGFPTGIAFDRSGNLYVTCDVPHAVFKVDLNAQLTIFAGSGAGGFDGDGGPATGAGTLSPAGIALDRAGNVFFADFYDHRIRRVDAQTGIITTMAGNGTAGFSGDGGVATNAQLNYPWGVASDEAGNVFVADYDNHRIRRVDAQTGIITTVAGNGTAGSSGDGGPATNAQLNSPGGVAADPLGNLFIADSSNGRVRRVDGQTGIITTVAGNGALSFPIGVTFDADGNIIIADWSGHRIRRVDAHTGTITTLAGNGTAGFSGDGGPGVSAQLNYPGGVGFDAAGNLLIADYYNHRVRRVDGQTGIITTLAGNGTAGFSGDGGPATNAELSLPEALAADRLGNFFLADYYNHRVRRVDAQAGIITTVAGNGTAGFSGDGGPATNAELRYPEGLGLDPAGNLFIADSSNSRIRRVDAQTGIIATIAGNGTAGFSGDGGPATNAQLKYPAGVALDAAGNLFIADYYNHRIRRVDGQTGIIITVAGNGTAGFSGDGGPATNAELNFPTRVGLDAAGNLLIADYGNSRIRRVDSGTGIITTVAGNGSEGFSGDGGPATDAELNYPAAVAFDAAGNLFIADSENYRIRWVDVQTGIIATVAGNGTAGLSGDGGPASNAKLSYPYDVAIDGQENLLIADSENNRIRRVGLSSTRPGPKTVSNQEALPNH